MCSHPMGERSFLRKLLNMFLALCLLMPNLSSAALAQANEQLQTNNPIADKWAVVIGVSQFADKSINLKYAAKDASDFRDFIVNKCNFAADHVRLLTNEKATKENILDLLGDSFLPRVALPDDLVLIYFSSHGSASDLDLRGVNYLIAHDTVVDRLYSTGIEIQTLANIVKTRIHCNRALIVLDACHSGGANEDSKGIHRSSNVDAAAIAQGSGRAVICSSSKTQSSWESKSYPNGVFTKSLIDSFNIKGDKTTLTEAFNNLKTGVQSQVAAERGVMQTPILEAGKWTGGDLVLAVKPASPRQLPASVLEAVESRISTATHTATGTSAPDQEKSKDGLGSSKSASAIPNIVGSFMGSNGLKYSYWQTGRKCGWSMPQFGVVGTCLISEDGLSLYSIWKGFVNGTSTSQLEIDSTGKVIKISADDGTVLTRMEN